METQENNKLIAEFMGIGIVDYAPYPEESSYGRDFHIDDVEYHNSWDWLMPVVEKIETIGFFVMIGVKKDSLITEIRQNNSDKLISEGWGKDKMVGVYSAVVEFILWYNQQKLWKKLV